MNGNIPGWLAEALGVHVPSNADGATWRLDSSWNWAPWATLLLVVGVVFWTLWLYSREASGARRPYRALLAGLRITALGLVLIMLAQWAIALRVTGPPSVALVVDRSSSMGIADHYDERAMPAELRERLVAAGMSEATRINLAKLLLSEPNGGILAELRRRYRVELYLAADGLERVPEDDDGKVWARVVQELAVDDPGSQATRIGDGLMRILGESRGSPPAAVILLTDGVVTEGLSLADAARHARRSGVPLYAIGLGNDQPPRDIELADVLVDDVVFVNDLVSVEAQIKATGLKGESAQITLRREGVSEPLAQQSVALPASGKTLSVRLVDRPTEPGDVVYVVEIAPRDDETNKQNNRQHRTVAVRDEKIRVLLAQGYPSYEFRYLKTLLERDRTIELATYLQDADPEYAEQDKTALRSFPIDRDELLDYDVLIVGDVDPRLLPRSVWQNLRAFVSEKGGGAAFIAGPRYFPWLYQDNSDVTTLLPIDLNSIAAAGKLPEAVTQGFVVGPTSLGLQSPAFQLGDTPAETEQIWTHLAPLHWLYEVGTLKAGAQVLAVGPGTAPVIVTQYFGAGRVLFHAIDSTWRWRIGAGDPYFARYWVQTIRSLARGKLSRGRGVQLTTDRREYRRGEAVQVRARFLDPRLAPAGDEVAVVIDVPGQARRRVVLGRNTSAEGVFDGSISDLPEGRFDVLLAEPQVPGNPPAVQFAVVAPPGEFARMEMDSAALGSATDATHGKLFTIADAGNLLNELPAGRRVPLENLPPISIWNRWWFMAAFLICLTSEWLLRKRKGML